MAKPNNNNASDGRYSKARYGMGKNKEPFISAWCRNGSKGAITLIASPTHVYSGDKRTDQIIERENKKGEVYEQWTCKLKHGITTATYTGFYNPTNGKLRIPEIGYVASTRAAHGGYFGKGGKPKR